MIDNKRIAKNTIYLYVRTMVVMAVALYTSRLVLQALGETDLGIWNIVGGIVTLMAFLQNAQAKATSRFITYEIGNKGSQSKALERIFSTCMTIHILIALLILFFAETIGLWLMNYATAIPDDRIIAANIVYQVSALTFFIGFIRVPYDSVIVAHENMSVYAYMSILEVSLQLAVVLYLVHYKGDSFIFYGIMHMVISVVVMFCYIMYVRVKYQSYRFRWLWDKDASMKIMKFSGWTMFGTSANTFTQQGVCLLLNNFVGLVANTALGFANQVNSAVSRFIAGFTTAFNPQIIKSYAAGKIAEMHTLMSRAAKFGFVLSFIFALPLILNMEFILTLWLGRVPQYTAIFCQLILVCSTIDATTGVLNTAIIASGKIKKYQFCITGSFLLDLLVSFLLLLANVHPALVFGSRILTRGILNMLIGMLVARNMVAYPISRYIKDVLIPVFATILLSAPLSYYVASLVNGWTRLFASSIVSIILIFICLWFIIMKSEERRRMLSFAKSNIYGRR